MATFGLPLALFGIVFLIGFLLFNQRPERAIGYVDHDGVLAQVREVPAITSDGRRAVPLVGFADEAAARAALLAGKVSAYLVLPPGYRATGAATIYSRSQLSAVGAATLRDFLRSALVADRPAPIAARAVTPIRDLTWRALDSDRVSDDNGIAATLTPILLGLLFMVSVFFSSGTLLMGLIEEKENRTMEIVITSIAPWQLIGGKTLGLGLLGLTQALIWASGGITIWAITVAQFTALRTATLPLDLMLIAALFFIPGYLLYAGCMVGIGAIVTSVQEAQQFTSVLSLVALTPFMAGSLFASNPNGAVPLFLSLFPLTAPIALVMRLPLVDVPPWQVVASFALVVLSAAGAIWSAAQLLRAGMLRYGKRLSAREFLSALRAGMK